MTVAAPVLRLALLPDELLVLILDDLSVAQVIAVSSVCKGWYLDPGRDALWRGLARGRGLQLPARNRQRATRLSVNLKRAFVTAALHLAQANVVVHDKAVWGLWLKLHSSDCPSELNKVLKRATHFNVDHRLGFFHRRSLLMLACWRGRSRFVARLLALGADASAQDDHGATALLMACWAGHASVVELLVKSLRDEEQRRVLCLEGFSPMTSSCGGRGPFTPRVWARRKQHARVLAVLEALEARQGSGAGAAPTPSPGGSSGS